MRDKYHVLMLTALSEGRVATQAFTKREVKFLASISVQSTAHPDLNPRISLADRLLQVNLDIHTFYGVGVDGSQMDEELIVDLDTMQFKSKGFLLPSSGICWIER